MRDADSHRESITDALMRGETVAKVRLNDVLEGDLILGDELAFVLSPIRWPERLQRLEDLERKARKCVERFVNEHMDDEVRERIDADDEADELLAEQHANYNADIAASLRRV